MKSQQQFEVIVIGGGHAGCEAASASARMGCRTLLLTGNIETIGQMSCNPAIGGIGKSHLVKEIDAMGGLMARAADAAGIHFRILNKRKGPAVRATRAQADRGLYKQFVRNELENQSNLFLFQQTVEDLIISNGKIAGVVSQMGLRFYAPRIILTVGTFLAGSIHVGRNNFSGGRAGDPAANALAQTLRELPFRVNRLKTGTPPRIDGRSIDFSQLESQPGEDPLPRFSYWESNAVRPKQVCCYMTRTNNRTHEIIKEGIADSPMFSGDIKGVGPRYCPSIEDKIYRFAQRDGHNIFLEPEGLYTNEFYPNGISTSLPFNIQQRFVQSIKGMEQAHITRPGYAIEYDFFDPRDLNYTLESTLICGLYLAGQINGTTGYEEAAAQGLVAGINAALHIQGKQPWYPRRDQAYIGVLLDDLITLGTQEPYRMFTSRSEYRLLLREDNADWRLAEIAYNDIGCLSQKNWDHFSHKKVCVESEIKRIKSTWVQPQTELAKKVAAACGIENISKQSSVADILRRPEVNYDALMSVEELAGVDTVYTDQVEIQIKYEGYLLRQHQEVAKLKQQEAITLPHDIDYKQVCGLSNEAYEKLMASKPISIAQASRIPGITPATLSLLLVHLRKLTQR